MCRGCRLCFDRGEEHCPLKDDLPSIKAKMDEADGFVVASPVYVNDVNGVAKNWMDRLAYVCHRPALAGKCVYLLATVADSPTGHALRTLNVGLRTWGFHIVGEAGFKMGARMPDNELKTKLDSAASRIADELYGAVVGGRYLRPSFLSLMVFRIQQLSWRGHDPESLDYAYWQERGWFDPSCTFYVNHRAHPVKVTAARLAGTVLSRFVA
jgi:NAD(P)H-dependent FMN reductase